MYDEMVKRLRTMADWVGISFLDNSENVRINLSEAADAIEELNKLHETQKKNLSVITDAYMKSWIPVTERLPNEKEKVLAVCKNGKMFVAEHLSNTYCNDGWNVIGPLGGKRRIGNNRVTHWMPLPQKPISE